MRLRIVAGIDVAATAPAAPLPSRDAIEEHRERLDELFACHKQAEGEYRRCLVDVARAARLPVLQVAAILRARRRRDPKPLSPRIGVA